MHIILANNGWPWLFSYDRVAFLIAVPCMLLESVIVRMVCRCAFSTALKASLAANAVSALLGLPMAALVVFAVYMPLDTYWSPVAAHFGTLAVFWIASVFIEAPVLRRFGLSRALFASFWANTFSYFIITLLATFTRFVGIR